MKTFGPEDRVHMEIMDWLEAVLPGAYVYHVANERKCSQRLGQKLKLLGVKAGIPDIHVILPGPRLILIEVKAPKGTLNPPQKAFARVADTLKVPYFVARGVEDCRQAFRDLGIKTREVIIV